MTFRFRGKHKIPFWTLEKWLQLRVLARTDAYPPVIECKGKQKPVTPTENKRSLPT